MTAKIKVRLGKCLKERKDKKRFFTLGRHDASRHHDDKLPTHGRVSQLLPIHHLQPGEDDDYNDDDDNDDDPSSPTRL